MKKQKSVCIIGAGAGGLCALRHFTAAKHENVSFEPIICFEQSEQIGGTWVYNEEVGTPERPVHSSMYRDLRVNGPVQVMDFPDFPFESDISYTHHSKVLEYLLSYAEHFRITPYIRFRHSLLKISKIQNKDDNETESWLVSVLDQANNQTTDHVFDVVVLCPGRYSIPKWPLKLEGLEDFSGSVIHSHDYRHREPYSGQRVVVVGAGPSGIDLTLEVASVAKEVIFLKHGSSKRAFPNLPANVRQIRGEIVQFSGPNSLSLSVLGDANDDEHNEELKDVDTVILATGYKLSCLHYLDLPSCGLSLNSKEDIVEGLYRQIINIQHPSMALLSVCKPTVSFPLFHQQVLYFIKTLQGCVQLPSKEQMYAEEAEELKYRMTKLGQQAKDRHQLKGVLSMRTYFERLEHDGHLMPISQARYSLLEEIIKTRALDPAGYRVINYRYLDNEKFEVIDNK